MAMPESVTNADESGKKMVGGFDLRKWAEQIGGNSAEAIEAAVYFGLYFGIGFLCKKYFQLLLVCGIFAAFSILALEYLKFLTLDWVSIKSSLGISAGMDFNAIITHCFDWIKAHMLLFIASTVGFLVGYKLG